MSSSGPSASARAVEDTRLRTALETKGFQFHIKTGNSRWQCTVRDRASHEREKAARESSSSSVTTLSSTSSASTTGSH